MKITVMHLVDCKPCHAIGVVKGAFRSAICKYCSGSGKIQEPITIEVTPVSDEVKTGT